MGKFGTGMDSHFFFLSKAVERQQVDECDGEGFVF